MEDGCNLGDSSGEDKTTDAAGEKLEVISAAINCVHALLTESED